MKTTTIASIASLPLILAGGILSNAMPASAALLTGNLQLAGGLQIPNPTTILFSPDVENPPNTAPVGDYASVVVQTAENTESFEVYNAPNLPNPLLPYLGQVLSIDTALGLPVEDFLLLPAVTEGADSIAATSITLESFVTQDLGIVNGFQQFGFTGVGSAFNEGDETDVRFDFTAQGDVGDLTGPLTPEQVAGLNFSYSGTVAFESVDVPEPSSLGAVIGFGMLGGSVLFSRSRKRVKSLSL